MFTPNIKTRIVILIVFMLLSLFSFASKPYEKIIEKTFAVSAEGELKINNKYGNISIQAWEEKSVWIKVSVKIETKNKKQSDLFFKSIGVELTQTNKKIFAETKIWEALETGEKFSIDYEIFMPENMKLDLTNHFGDVFIQSLNQQARISLEYGNLEIGSLLCPESKPIAEINLTYVKAKIRECNKAKLNLKFSKINIETSKTLIVLSRHSMLRATKNEAIIADSKFDCFKILSSDILHVNKGEYSQFKLENINQRLELNLKHGECKVQHVSANFESIKVNHQELVSKIAIEEGANYRLESKTENLLVEYPEEAKILEKNESYGKTILKCVVGNSPNPERKIELKGRNGKFMLTSSVKKSLLQ